MWQVQLVGQGAEDREGSLQEDKQQPCGLLEAWRTETEDEEFKKKKKALLPVEPHRKHDCVLADTGAE